MGKLSKLLVMVLFVPALMTFGTSAMVGCDDGGTDGDGDGDGDGDADCTADTMDDGEEAVFVVNTLVIGDVNQGFNLDGVDTPDGCEGDVLCLDGPDDGEGGVDNRLGPILDAIGGFVPEFDANTLIADSILAGDLIILFRMMDIDDWSNDQCVPMYVYMGHDPTEPPTVEEGRTYQVDARSLNVGTDIDDPMISFDDSGMIASGGYSGGPADFNIAVPFDEEGSQLVINISDSMLQSTVSATGVTGGVLGGYVRIHDMLRAISQVEAAADFIEMAPALLENQGDIDAIPAGTEIPGTSCTPENVGGYSIDGEGCGTNDYTCSAGGLCVEPADHFDAISIGLSLTGVPALIDMENIYNG